MWLIKAVDKFNPEMYNNTFSTYAYFIIIKEINRYLTNSKLIKFPAYITETNIIKDYNKIQNKMLDQHSPAEFKMLCPHIVILEMK